MGMQSLYLPNMITYAQNFEDVILRRALQDIDHGFYVDVGAYHPTSDSVSCWFYNSGWNGVNIEPNPEMFEVLVTKRPRDTNLQVAVADIPGRASLYIYDGIYNGMSTTQPEVVATHQAAGIEIYGSIQVEIVTLDQVFRDRRVAGKAVDFLKIDVEGSEAQIIKTTEFNEFRPRILVIEAILPGSRTPSWADWEGRLLRKGYRFVLFDGLNRFYLREEDSWRRSFFQEPPNLFDSIHYLSADHRVQVAVPEKLLCDKREVGIVAETALSLAPA
jgi:FkbM family methyltransferase